MFITYGRSLSITNKISIVSSYPAHMDAEVWNTKGGAHPFDKFWAERFSIDPNDPESGPTRMNVTGHGNTDNKKLIYNMDDTTYAPVTLTLT